MIDHSVSAFPSDVEIDIFGRLVRDAPLEPVMDRLDLWGCSNCGAEFPASFGVDIILLGPGYMLCFCSADCAIDANYPEAARQFRAFYKTTGHACVILTEDQRLPDPERAEDLEAYPDAILALAEIFSSLPSFAMMTLRDARDDASDIDTWGDVAE
jgi:hypothetical protein